MPLSNGQPTPQAWQPKRDPLVWGVAAVYLALAIGYSYVMELGYAPDEVTRHLPYIEWLADERCLPPADPTVDCGPLELHPPLYYLLLTPVREVAEPFGRRAVLRALRWTSPFLVLAALLLWFAVLRRACRSDRTTTLFAFALTGWWPNLHVDSGALNNDVGAILLSALIAHVICARQWELRSPGSATLWGLLVGIGALMKSSVLTTCVPVVAVALVWQHGRRFYADRRFWIRCFAAAAACAVVCGWWYARNLRLHGALIPVPEGYSLIPPGMDKLTALFAGLVWGPLLRAVNGLWVSAFAGAVWFPDELHGPVYGALRLLTVLGIIGLGVGGYRLVRGRAHFEGGQAPAFWLPSTGFLSIYFSAVWVSVFVHAGVFEGGRYLMPFLPGLTVPLALALKQLVPVRLRALAFSLIAAFFLALNFLAWYHLLTYWNPYVLATAGRFG